MEAVPSETTLDHKTTADMNSFATVIFKPLRDGFKEPQGHSRPQSGPGWQQTRHSAANPLFSLVLFYCAGTLMAQCWCPGEGLIARHGRDRL